MATEAFDGLLKHNGFVPPTCLAGAFSGEDSPSYTTQKRRLIKWARLRGLDKSSVTITARSIVTVAVRLGVMSTTWAS